MFPCSCLLLFVSVPKPTSGSLRAKSADGCQGLHVEISTAAWRYRRPPEEAETGFSWLNDHRLESPRAQSPAQHRIDIIDPGRDHECWHSCFSSFVALHYPSFLRALLAKFTGPSFFRFPVRFVATGVKEKTAHSWIELLVLVWKRFRKQSLANRCAGFPFGRSATFRSSLFPWGGF